MFKLISVSLQAITDYEAISSFVQKERLYVRINDPLKPLIDHQFTFSFDNAKRYVENFAAELENSSPHLYFFLGLKTGEMHRYFFSNTALIKIWAIFQEFVKEYQDKKGEK